MTSFQDLKIQDLGFTGTDRYDLVRILRAGGPASDHDARLLEDYNRRALSANSICEPTPPTWETGLVMTIIALLVASIAPFLLGPVISSFIGLS